MKKLNEVLTDNIDVLILSDGTRATVKQYIDIKIAEGVAVRVCLVEDFKTKEQHLYLDKQLVATFEKHEQQEINSYYVTWFYGNNHKGEEEQVIGDGNLLKLIYKINLNIPAEENAVNKVMVVIKRKMGVIF